MTGLATLLTHTHTRDGLLRLLRQAHEEAGQPTLRTLERRARQNGTPVSKSSLSDMLAGRRLPSQGVVGAFLQACGIDDPADLAEWESAWSRAARDLAPQRSPEPDPTGIDLPPSESLGGRFAMVMGLDIADFGAAWRDDDARAHIRSALFSTVRSGFEEGRIPWSDVYCEDRGDGALVIAPSDASPEILLGLVLTEIARLVRRHNRLSSAVAQLRVRIALHVGYMRREGQGFSGHALVLPWRLVDARPFKQRCDEEEADVGVILSDYLYDEMVRNGILDPGDYVPLSLPVKGAVEQGWVRLLREPPTLGEPPTGVTVRDTSMSHEIEHVNTDELGSLRACTCQRHHKRAAIVALLRRTSPSQVLLAGQCYEDFADNYLEFVATLRDRERGSLEPGSHDGVFAALGDATPVSATASGQPIVTADAPHERYGLSAREAEIIELVAEGMSNPQISDRLFISQKTVKNHLNRIFAKLHVTNRSDAVEVWGRGGPKAEATP